MHVSPVIAYPPLLIYLIITLDIVGASQVAQCWKNLPANAGNTRGAGLIPRFGKEVVTHSGILAREIPWTEEPSGLESMGLQRTKHWLGTAHQHHQLVDIVTFLLEKIIDKNW